MQAVGLLHELGYTNVRHYSGGIADWVEQGLPVEGMRTEPAARTSAVFRTPPSTLRVWEHRLIEALNRRSIAQLLLLWALMIVGFGVIYWLDAESLRLGGAAIGRNVSGLLTAIYFSFVTALSIGYGDVVPVGAVRVLAVLKGIGGLLIFGCVISKLVSQRQEELIEEIHRITFEDRLGRVRTNLHLVLSELQAIAEMCEGKTVRPERATARIESAAAVFAGELQAVHDLLYRPQQAPDEEVLEVILANLTATLRELHDLLFCQADLPARARTLSANLRSIVALANEICGECVPRAYAPELKGWMDQIQELARGIGRQAE